MGELSKKARFLILHRDAFTCRYCGLSAPHVVLEVDHVIPRSLGGSNANANLVTSCWDCNRGKRALDAGSGLEASAWIRRLATERDNVLDALIDTIANDEPIRRRVELLVDEIAHLQGLPPGDVWDWLHNEIPVDE